MLSSSFILPRATATHGKVFVLFLLMLTFLLNLFCSYLSAFITAIDYDSYLFSFPDRKDRKPLLKELPVFNPQGGNPDFKERRWSKVFLGFEIFDSGIFGVGKFG